MLVLAKQDSNSPMTMGMIEKCASFIKPLTMIILILNMSAIRLTRAQHFHHNRLLTLTALAGTYTLSSLSPFIPQPMPTFNNWGVKFGNHHSRPITNPIPPSSLFIAWSTAVQVPRSLSVIAG